MLTFSDSYYQILHTFFKVYIKQHQHFQRITAKEYSKIRLFEEFVQTILTFSGGKPNNTILISHLGSSTGIIAHGAFFH